MHLTPPNPQPVYPNIICVGYGMNRTAGDQQDNNLQPVSLVTMDNSWNPDDVKRDVKHVFVPKPILNAFAC